MAGLENDNNKLIEELMEEYEAKHIHLSAWELEFLEQVGEQGLLSEKQEAKLWEIHQTKFG